MELDFNLFSRTVVIHSYLQLPFSDTDCRQTMENTLVTSTTERPQVPLSSAAKEEESSSPSAPSSSTKTAIATTTTVKAKAKAKADNTDPFTQLMLSCKTDPLLSDVPIHPTIEELDQLISFEKNQAVEITIERPNLPPISEYSHFEIITITCFIISITII